MDTPPLVAGRPAGAPRTRPPGWIVWWLRIATTAHLAGVLGQAVLAGLFVTGNVDMLVQHRDNAGLTHTMLYLQLVAAILLWRPGRGPSWPAWASAALVALETVQVMLGLNRVLAGHFPLGVTIFGVSAVMAAWTWWGLRARRGSAT
ncbi:hypothetical protein [Microtetraspora sp. NBRC 16547]|uniref:hypothetical protein n=1 Tax=Microtetraspora sp. NBRC 16547 TaxID=3030993 RepID=UPI0025540C05|nr:hypothetical protein [Microtetraspora sp. NBRC 16547]